MTAIKRVLAWLDWAEEAFMATALAVMTAMTFIQVILRYLFHASLVWSLEATTYTFAWLVVVGMAYGVRTRAHIAVDLLTRTLPPVAQRIVAGFGFTLCLTYCALMIFGGAQFVDGLIMLGHNAQDIPVPRWSLASILPLGFALLALRLLQAGWRYLAPGGSTVEGGGS